ncbi:MAG: hypothetical protein KDJ50_00385 [Alphaproteobacteria bacterium]|nr:hypothetical protein [Alphaproteobacteria bacterium]
MTTKTISERFGELSESTRAAIVSIGMLAALSTLFVKAELEHDRNLEAYSQFNDAAKLLVIQNGGVYYSCAGKKVKPSSSGELRVVENTPGCDLKI